MVARVGRVEGVGIESVLRMAMAEGLDHGE
jgi:hypothetical protein